MTSGHACVIFEFRGRRYEYDGGLPHEVMAAVPELYDAEGFWRADWPKELETQGADERDELPTALWEIAHVGGHVVEIQGAQPNGAIHWEDWKNPRIY